MRSVQKAKLATCTSDLKGFWTSVATRSSSLYTARKRIRLAYGFEPYRFRANLQKTNVIAEITSYSDWFEPFSVSSGKGGRIIFHKSWQFKTILRAAACY